MGTEAAPVKGSPPPACVVVTPPAELLGAEETVPPTELLVVSSTVVLVSPLVELAPVVVVSSPLVVVSPTVVLVSPVLVVGLSVLVVGLSVLVVVPPVVVAEANCPTLTPATTIRATATSQAAVRFCAFFVCLAIDAYRHLSSPRDRWIAAVTGPNRSRSLRLLTGRVGGVAHQLACVDQAISC
jgi:hypothetical protein